MEIRSGAVWAAVALGAGCGVSNHAYRESLAAFEQTTYTPHTIDDGADLFAGAATLDQAALVSAVLERNPSIEAARQGWRAALREQGEATSFDDPMVALSVAPLSLFSDDVDIGYTVEVSQPLPWFGKRRLRGELVVAEAEAMREDYRMVRRRLALMATTMFYDYYTIARALDVNQNLIELLEEEAQTVGARLEAGGMWQEDALMLEVGIAQQHKMRAELEANRDVVKAQLNALLHRRPTAALPPPPAALAEPPPAVDDPSALEGHALETRPELRAVSSREHAASTMRALAVRDYYPDVRVMGMYNRMWPMLEHQIMIGVSFELPVQRSRRSAAVDVAEARIARARAERDGMADEIREQVATARRRAEEADAQTALYRDRAMPAARDRVVAIRLGLDANRTSLIEVIRAERELRELQLQYFEAVASAYRWRAQLDWAAGRTPGLATRDGGDQ